MIGWKRFWERCRFMGPQIGERRLRQLYGFAGQVLIFSFALLFRLLRDELDSLYSEACSNFGYASNFSYLCKSLKVMRILRLLQAIHVNTIRSEWL